MSSAAIMKNKAFLLRNYILFTKSRIKKIWLFASCAEREGDVGDGESSECGEGFELLPEKQLPSHDPPT